MTNLFSKFALSSDVGNHTSGLGFGCMGITAFYGDPMPDDKAMELLKAVYDGGCRHFDTAEVYKQNDKYNEAVLGMFFKTVPRDSFSVATKYWPREKDFSYESVKPALVDSLKRLGLDYVDLYYAHRIYDLESTLAFGRTAKMLKEEGLIKEIGISEISGSYLRKVHTEVCPIDAVQQEWSLLTRSLEEDLVPTCKELGVTIVAYSPLARNMLVSKMEAAPSDWRGSLPRFSGDNFAKNVKIADVVQEIAEKYKCTPAQLALGWLFQKANSMGVQVVPIPGSTKIHHAMGNLESSHVKIDDEEDMKRLEALASQVAGERGPEWYMQGAIESQK